MLDLPTKKVNDDQKWFICSEHFKMLRLLLSYQDIDKMKRQPTKQKIFTNDTSSKQLIFKIYEEFIQMNTRKTNNRIKKWAQEVPIHILMIC